MPSLFTHFALTSLINRRMLLEPVLEFFFYFFFWIHHFFIVRKNKKDSHTHHRMLAWMSLNCQSCQGRWKFDQHRNCLAWCILIAQKFLCSRPGNDQYWAICISQAREVAVYFTVSGKLPGLRPKAYKRHNYCVLFCERTL